MFDEKTYYENIKSNRKSLSTFWFYVYIVRFNYNQMQCKLNFRRLGIR